MTSILYVKDENGVIQQNIPNDSISVIIPELIQQNKMPICKCGVNLPIPYYTIKKNGNSEMVCHMCEMLNEPLTIDNDSYKKQFYDKVVNLINIVRNCQIEECIDPDKDYIFVSKVGNNTEITRSCKFCISKFDHKSIFCNQCSSIVYTRFEYMHGVGYTVHQNVYICKLHFPNFPDLLFLICFGWLVLYLK